MPANTSVPQGGVRPHPLSNDLTDETLRQTKPEAAEERSAVVPKRERRIIGRVAALIGVFALVAVVVGAMLFPRTEVFIAGAAFIVVYLLFLSAPLILADTTKVAQDEAVKDSRAPLGTSPGQRVSRG